MGVIKIVKTWLIQTWSGAAWSATAAFNTGGGDAFTQNASSNSRYTTLADGSKGKIIPQVTTQQGPISLTWPPTDSLTLYTQLKGYEVNDTGVRITTHVVAEKLEGFFADVRVRRPLKRRQGAQLYIVTANFEPFDVDSSGDIGDA